MKNESTEKAIAIILLKDFGIKIGSLEKKTHVWIVSSELNDAAASVQRSRYPCLKITTVPIRKNEPDDYFLRRILIMIGDHHRVFETSDSSEYLFVVGATEKHKAVLMEDFDISSTGLGESVIEARLKDSQ